MKKIGIFSAFLIFFPSISLSNSVDVTYYYHQDHLGGTNIVTDQHGQIVEELDYFPYGSTRIDEKQEKFKTKYRFTDKESDEIIGLYYFGQRYYDSHISRFVSEDPIYIHNEFYVINYIFNVMKQPQDLNTYSYCANNPLIFVDPTGELKWKTLGAAVWDGVEAGISLATAAGKAIAAGGLLATGNAQAAGVMAVGALGSFDDATSHMAESGENVVRAINDEDVFEGEIEGLYTSLIRNYLGEDALNTFNIIKATTDLVMIIQAGLELSSQAKEFNKVAAKYQQSPDALMKFYQEWVKKPAAESCKWLTEISLFLKDIQELIENDTNSTNDQD